MTNHERLLRDIARDEIATDEAAAIRWVVRELDSLRSAVRRHRDMQADDRCWLDDYELYRALGEPAPESACQLNEPAVMGECCLRFIISRHDPSKPYLSPQWEIDRLKAALEVCCGSINAFLEKEADTPMSAHTHLMEAKAAALKFVKFQGKYSPEAARLRLELGREISE